MSTDRLLHLVDRARRGVILPAELDDLANGIIILGQQAESAVVLGRELDTLRRAQAAARTETKEV